MSHISADSNRTCLIEYFSWPVVVVHIVVRFQLATTAVVILYPVRYSILLFIVFDEGKGFFPFHVFPGAL